MSVLKKRTTIYLEPDLHKALRWKSKQTRRSLSALVNDAIREGLAEDANDLAVFDQREGEASITFEEGKRVLEKRVPGF